MFLLNIMNNKQYYTLSLLVLLIAIALSFCISIKANITKADFVPIELCSPPNPQCGPSDCNVTVCDVGTITKLTCPDNGDVCYDTCSFKLQCTFCYDPVTCKNTPTPTPTKTSKLTTTPTPTATPSGGGGGTPTPTPSMTAVDSITIVVTTSNSDPSVSGASVVEPDYCFSGPGATIEWSYDDGDNKPAGTDPQSAYQIQLSTSGKFSSPNFDSGKIISNSSSYFIGSGLDYDATYEVRMRVWDSHDTVSEWFTDISSFTTPGHAYPQIGFSWTPSTVHAKDVVQFTDNSRCYANGGDIAACDSWSWNFDDGGAGIQQNPAHTYSGSGLYNVSLATTDTEGHTCAVSQPINVISGGQQVPVWKEVAPH